ncbi:glycerol-3-phosphate responsive antiterminator [Geobacillus zalihae]|uniref:Glycerol uptake operon antiterminator regulatory protein n=1 Tax=Geobacillus zalihae TaxID=213419 RepID=A0A1V9CU85_9BACL|nr:MULTISPECIES: glycerol-3-phosphate responsive antiterminator [Geobacillus]EPR27677.1 Glycerol uptake operon antiterminator regulatory protein [Geobacillus sp. WSUCF1]OQP25223.1 glycerol-3-phosphate responsive antiterminator GlpP [Geobacillus zalihae]QNU19326.1 glycerol-3-phosphate responsive antiterminator [Geobacillus zalihae]QNU25384.1 glycerol-3-phosphate responsive antiterminator [Geobacillus zalihae]RXS86728.1 glycerol-3-phosphate responsive antiterminator [Geobacillus sp. PK12]
MEAKQRIIPAIKTMKQFDAFLSSGYTVGVLLEVHIAQLKSIFAYARRHGKELIIHVDLVQGLSHDEHAAEYLCQEFRPHGLISTKAGVIMKARQKRVLAVQRIFLLDSHALEKSYQLIAKTNPDCIEVIPGAMPHIIREVKERTGKPIYAGGLIRTVDDVERALEAGAASVTTSNETLWRHYNG